MLNSGHAEERDVPDWEWRRMPVGSLIPWRPTPDQEIAATNRTEAVSRARELGLIP